MHSQRKLARGESIYSNASAAESGAFNSNESNSNLPLNPNAVVGNAQHYSGYQQQQQQWDPRFIGGAVVAPTPHRPIGSGIYGPTPSASPAQEQQQPQQPQTFAAGRHPAQPKSPYGRVRDESGDWDTNMQGAYNLPTLREQSPFSAGFNNGGSALQSSPGAAPGKFVPPSGPPPHMQYTHHPPVTDPYGGGGGPSMSSPYPSNPWDNHVGPSTTAATTSLDRQSIILTDEPLTNPYALSDGTDLTPTPRQQTFHHTTNTAPPTNSSPQEVDFTDVHLPSPQHSGFKRHDTLQAGPPSSSNNPFAAAAHAQEATSYYTPSHSRVPTDQQAESVNSIRRSSPPPPSYHQ